VGKRKEAVAKLEALAASGAVSCKSLEDGQFGRKVADCFAGSVKLGQAMEFPDSNPINGPSWNSSNDRESRTTRGPF